MTSTRAIASTTASFVAVIAATAWLSLLADVNGHVALGERLNNTAWTLVMAGAMCAAAGLFLWMAWEFKNEVRGGAVAGSRPCPKGRVSVPSRSLKP